MNDLHPSSPLFNRIMRLRGTFDRAEEDLHHVLLLNAARLLRTAVPAAEAVLVEDVSFDGTDHEPDLRLKQVQDAEGQPLWTEDDCRRRSSWDEAISHIEYVLTLALGARPARCWWDPVGTCVDTYWVPLPHRSAVAAAMTEPVTT